MIQINLHHVEELERLFERTPREARTVISRAINRAAISARARASQEIRAKYIIRASDIKGDIKIDKSTSGKLKAEIRASGPTIPLMKFDVSPKKPNDAIVHARVKKGGSRKPIQQGFIVSAYNNVFARVGDSRYPIKGLYGPSIAQMLGEASILTSVVARAHETLDNRLEHEMNRLIYGG
ncbi:phage tail protein [Lysinibacillus fusiformis]|uniref:phage tail protein n=1 Tax=Lysinibacillus fusiformis TaxID=28031 RepID=UPI0035BFDCFC|nr:phage tail protein [Lysinibacillus fusiformis]